MSDTAPARVGPAHPRARILVVDDEAAIRTLYSTILTTAGYEVILAANGNEAIKLLNALEFHLLITDLVMPDREGLETIQAVRKAHPQVKVIAVSGAFGGSSLKVAGMLGATSTLRKPVAGEELVAAVRAVLGEE